VIRQILAVIVGYVVMFVIVFTTFSAAYFALGADRAFKPGTYDVSVLWIGLATLLGLLAAAVGGAVCGKLAKGGRAHYGLAALVLVLGLLQAGAQFAAPKPNPGPRGPDVSNVEAMTKAQPPMWAALVNPVIGVIGVLLGARPMFNRRP
jgi:hypothetical protein